MEQNYDQQIRNTPIAVIGMAGIFPESPNLKGYWRLLVNGKDAITEIPDHYWNPADYFDQDPAKPDHVYCTRGGFISPVPFDPSEFGIPPNSLEATDTSQLLALVAAKAALKDAGYDNGRPVDRRRISVMLGVTGTQELVLPLASRLGFPKWRKALLEAGIDSAKAESIMARISEQYVSWQENSFPGLLGNVVAGRICNRLDLGGTNCAVDAACASSMSGIHMAMMELVTGRSDMVITGGVDCLNDIFMYMCFSKTRILSPTGDARPFSQHADGTVLGEGIGLLVLKRLPDAERDQDRIYAVIKGIGTSSDGKAQSIYAPRAEGQMNALRQAYTLADIPPATVSLIEAHGTGTRVGDLVEIKALKQVFQQSGEVRNGDRCAIGSVKSMIGHTKAAAGSAGLIKSVLALHHKVLLPTLKAEAPDPNLGLDDSPFYINHAKRPWLTADNVPRRSGVSAFGFGGSNFHVVLEEYQREKQVVSWDGSVEIMALSADSEMQLAARLRGLADELSPSELREEILSHKLMELRQAFVPSAPRRLLVVIERTTSMLQAVRQTLARLNEHLSHHSLDALRSIPNVFYGGPGLPGKLAALFPGQGSQYVGMGKDLVCIFPEALRSIEAAAARFNGEHRLGHCIYPYPGASPEQMAADEAGLRQTNVAQPAIGAVSAALWRTATRFGVAPDCFGGHSFGELMALFAAGRMAEDDFFRLAALRGQLMAAAAGGDGGMLAVFAPLDAIGGIARQASPSLVIANRNSPEQGVLSGRLADIAQAETIAREQGFRVLRLPVSAAFHSPLVTEAASPFAAALEQIPFSPGVAPIFSNAAGEPYPPEAQQVREILGRQMLCPVDFIAQIQRMIAFGVNTFVEIGPKSILTQLCKAIVADNPGKFNMFSLDASAGKASGLADLARFLCRLSALGHSVNLAEWEHPETPEAPPKMNIPLTGANYRTPPQKSEKLDAPSTVVKTTSEFNKPSAVEAVSKPVVSTPAGANRYSQCRNQAKMEKCSNQPRKSECSAQPGYLNALKLFQDGLKTIETLQLKTAEAHQQFLETQRETGQILKQMMDSTHRFTQASLGATPIATMVPAVAYQPPKALPLNSVQSAPKPLAAVIAQPAAPEPSVPPPPAPVAPPVVKTDGIAEAVLEIVSQLTGYPLAMLSLDMDIEADLGIDSIKRVEILSALEEKTPGLPAVSPELMGTFKTLRQVCQYLTPTAGGAAEVPAPTPNPAPAAPAPSTQHPGLKLEYILLDVVAGLTGYPREMLSLSMDIEADLGIDSIKRVEILSSLEERIPDLPQLSPEIVGSLNTLGQILDHITQAMNPASGPETSASAVETTLLAIVSRLTGYPTAMLHKDMNIEADLGIDSIKRVEILSSIEEALPHLPQISPEMIGTLKTLGEIAAYLAQDHGLAAVPEAAKNQELESLPPAVASVVPTPVNDPANSTVASQTIMLAKQPALSLPPLPALAGTVVITADESGLGQALAAELSQLGVKTAVWPLATIVSADPPVQASGLILIPAASLKDHECEFFLKQAFLAAKKYADLLSAAAHQGAAVFAGLTRLDGGFGFLGLKGESPTQGGLAGLIKTAALEWPGVSCHALDIDPAWNKLKEVAQAAAREILTVSPSSPVEVGLTPTARYFLELQPVSALPGRLRLCANDVVVISGGARGVTAEAAVLLAETVRPRLALLGRSPQPEPEPDWLSPLESPAEMKQAIFNHAFPGKTPSPAELEKIYAAYQAAREIRQTLSRIRATGAQADYHSVDIRDYGALDAILEETRSAWGPIKAVIHGAGVIEDRLIVAKTPEQFAQVFDTKVTGLKALLEALRQDVPAYLVLFSSVSARMGNVGQADYAMANEVLNKIAQQYALNRPETRVLSVNWGPFDGGMVKEALKREFHKRGVGLIPPREGARLLLREMSTEQGPVEIVAGSRLRPNTAAADRRTDVAPPPSEVSFAYQREIDIKHFPVLESHVIEGKPTVPLALMTEWLGHGALHGNPGLLLHGFDDIRLLQTIRLDQNAKHIRVVAGKARKNGSLFEVKVEIRDGFKDGKDVIHTTAKAILTNALIDMPEFHLPQSQSITPYPRRIEEVYNKILFHGAALRGIKDIVTCASSLMIARIAGAPAPEQWVRQPLRSNWIGDPLVLDSACQMATIWCFEQVGLLSAPSYSKSYRQFSRTFPEDGVTAVLEIRSYDTEKMIGDFSFIDANNRLIAKLTGYEAVFIPSGKLAGQN